MSSANDISLDEIGRLIKILGLLGSAADGEALNAARLACRWVADKGTSWEALLVPAPEVGVVAVVAPQDPDALAEAFEADRVAAYRNGFQAGLAAANAQWGQQLRAQNAFAAGQGRAYSGNTGAAGSGQRPGPAGPVAAPGGAANAMSQGMTWQQVAQTLLDRHASGIPGVLRSREESFVADILKRGFATLTQPQEDWLRAIAGRSAMSW